MIRYESREQEAAKFQEICLILAAEGEDPEEIEDYAHRIMNNPAHYPCFFPGTYDHYDRYRYA